MQFVCMHALAFGIACFILLFASMLVIDCGIFKLYENSELCIPYHCDFQSKEMIQANDMQNNLMLWRSEYSVHAEVYRIICSFVCFMYCLDRVSSYKSCIVKFRWFEPRLRDAKIQLKGIYTYFHTSVKPSTILIKWTKHNCNWIYCLKQKSAHFVR